MAIRGDVEMLFSNENTEIFNCSDDNTRFIITHLFFLQKSSLHITAQCLVTYILLLKPLTLDQYKHEMM